MKILEPELNRAEATDLIMGAIDWAQADGLTFEQAGEAVAKAAKGWRSTGFNRGQWTALLCWSIEKRKAEAV